jgi:hypothetical protein
MSHSIITRGPIITDNRASPILDGQSTITLFDVMSYGPVICAISSFLTIRDCLSLSETSNETKDLVDPVIGGKLIDKPVKAH